MTQGEILALAQELLLKAGLKEINARIRLLDSNTIKPFSPSLDRIVAHYIHEFESKLNPDRIEVQHWSGDGTIMIVRRAIVAAPLTERMKGIETHIYYSVYLSIAFSTIELPKHP